MIPPQPPARALKFYNSAFTSSQNLSTIIVQSTLDNDKGRLIENFPSVQSFPDLSLEFRKEISPAKLNQRLDKQADADGKFCEALSAIKTLQFLSQSEAFKNARMSGVEIRVAKVCEVQIVVNLMSTHFIGSEPTMMAHVKKDEKLDTGTSKFIEDCIKSETVFLARISETPVGVLIAGEINLEVGDPLTDDLDISDDSKGSDIGRLLQFVIDRADVCNRLQIQSSLHIHIVAVHQDFLRRGISKQLFKACERTAREKNFPAISVDCTSFYTAKIADCLGWRCISTVTYDEFHEHLGRVAFEPIEPHLDIRTFAKVFERE